MSPPKQYTLSWKNRGSSRAAATGWGVERSQAGALRPSSDSLDVDSTQSSGSYQPWARRGNEAIQTSPKLFPEPAYGTYDCSPQDKVRKMVLNPGCMERRVRQSGLFPQTNSGLSNLFPCCHLQCYEISG